LQQLSHKISSFGFCQTFAAFDHLVHTLIVTQLKQNVTVLPILEEMLVLANVFVLQCSVNFNLSLQLSKGKRTLLVGLDSQERELVFIS
jgi:hypothetical protein